MGLIDDLIEAIVEYSGPLGKFVVIKSIKDLDYDPNNLTRDEIRTLINTVTERAIFDPERRRVAKRKLLKAFLH